MRILVTGAGGFVGPHMVGHLLDLGHEVAGLARDWGARATLHSYDRWTQDLAEREQLAARVRRFRPEGVVHLAAQASPGGSWDDSRETYRSNIEGTANLLDSVAGLDCRVLLVGSAQQYRRPEGDRPLSEEDPQQAGSPYALTKIAQEQMGAMYLERYGLGCVMTRSFNHTGPGQSPSYAVGSFCSQISRLERSGERIMRVQSLDAVRDFCDVRDVVRAYAGLLLDGKPGEAYNVCSGRGVRMGDVLDKLLQISGLGTEVRVVDRPAPAGGDCLVGDPAKIRAGLGWESEIPLERSLQDTLDWYRSDQEAGS